MGEEREKKGNKARRGEEEAEGESLLSLMFSDFNSKDG